MVHPFTSNGTKELVKQDSETVNLTGLVPDSFKVNDNDGSQQDSESEDEDEEGHEWDDWQESANTPTYSLITPVVLSPSVQEAFEHDMMTHNFCIKSLIDRLNLNCIDRIKLINWIRSGPQHGRSKDELDSLTGKESWLLEQSDEWLIPRVPGDGMLQYDFEEDDDDESSRVPSVSGLESQSAKKHLQPRQLCSNQVSPQVEIDRLCTELERLRQENSRTRELLGYTSSLLEDGHATFNSLNLTKPSPKTGRDDDTHYFSSYAHEGIHWTMIQDQIRTDSYRHFIASNPQLFKNKRVLDIGCGTGILSFFAAQAGAKKVYAIDASQIAKNASVNMKVNSITEIVKVLNKKVEDLNVDEDLDGERVDVIISEWMGYACLYEVFLPSVLIARDRFLKPKDCGGLMAPSQCSILMAGWGDETWWNDKVNWWDNNKYGFKMRESMTERMFKEGLIEDFPSSGILTRSMCLRDVLTTTMDSDIKDCISFTQPFTLRFSDQQVTNRKFYGFLIWFDTFFTCDGRPIDSLALEDAKKWKQSEGEVGFSTSAKATSTHWHQTLLLVKQPFEVNEDVEIEGSSTWTVQEDNGRELEISMMWRVRQNPQSDWGPYLAQVWTV